MVPLILGNPQIYAEPERCRNGQFWPVSKTEIRAALAGKEFQLSDHSKETLLYTILYTHNMVA